jgi:hypothetical protein
LLDGYDVNSLVAMRPGDSEIAGGAEEIRTPDLRRAKAALSQLSYGPSGVLCKCTCVAKTDHSCPSGGPRMVGGPFWTRTRDLSLIRTAL